MSKDIVSFRSFGNKFQILGTQKRKVLSPIFNFTPGVTINLENNRTGFIVINKFVTHDLRFL